MYSLSRRIIVGSPWPVQSWVLGPVNGVRWSPRDENLLIGTTRVQNFLLRARMLLVQGLLCRNLPPDTCLCVGVSSFTYVGGVQIAASWAKFAIRFRN